MKVIKSGRLRTWGICAAAIVVLIWSGYGSDVQVLSTINWQNLADFLSKWWPPSPETLGPALTSVVVTIQMAIFGTFIALILGFFSAFSAARNITSHSGFYTVMRGFLSVLRSVPVVVFGLIFVPLVGLGPLGGVMALVLHNWGVLGKLIAERIEASEPEPYEAVQSTGAQKLPTILYGIIPQIRMNILSDAFYRLEVNVRDTMVLGFIGAGGIGNDLFINFKSFDYASTTTDVLLIIAMVFILDGIGSFVRKWAR
jgi:phosphonate transport system permease protein